jgi:signal transduction histidine kinase
VVSDRLKKGEKVFDFTNRYRCKDGTYRWLTWVSHPILERGITFAVAHDITDRKKAEKDKQKMEFQLRRSQKMESIGTLAGGVAHEINNPINGIMNYAQLIKDKIDDGSPIAEYASEIINETKRVAQIVQNLLAFSRKDHDSYRSANIKDIVDNTMSLIKAVFRRDQIRLEVNVPEDLPAIKCRDQQIQQVIMNLMTNARDALNEKYPGYDENKVMEISSNLFEKDGKSWIRTTVKDRGIGIDPDVGERMFDPFFTTKERTVGTGLGLSISYGIVKDHHGELTFESKPGQYTKFHMDLPVDNGWELEEKQR